jgi:ParB family chromosome partitioning protein
MNHRETVNTRLIPLNKLEKSPQNVRRTLTGDGIGEMKASILAHGLMQNLVVTESGLGIYHVVAGARRLAALTELQAEGKLPEDFAVPCQVVAEERAFEMSLAENAVRLAMHPADQFEAFAALIDKGHTAAQVAVRFGVEESLVLKRMKLGRVAPELLQAYRDEDVTMESLMAFAVTDDHARQLAVYQSLQGWQKENPRHIRAALTEAMVKADGKLAKFVGMDTYEAAGGATRTDLFGEDVYLENPELLNALAGEKLKLIERELQAEGWGWVEVSPEHDWEFTQRCDRIHPVPADVPPELLDLKAQAEAELEDISQAVEDTESDALIDALDEAETRLAEIDERLDSFVAFDPEQQKLAGCYVTIGHDGELSVEKGLVRPEHRKALAASPDDDDGDDATPGKKNKMPETLRRDLEAYRLAAAQAEIAKHPAIAFDLLVFKAAKSVIIQRATYDGSDINFRIHSGLTANSDCFAFIRLQMDAVRETLPLDWQELDTEAEQFAAFQALTNDQKHALLAFCVASTLQPKLAPADGDEPSAYDLALSQTGADVATYWRPAKANYLSRITRDQLLAIGREVLGGQWAESRSKDKNGELVDQLDGAFADPKKHSRAPEQVAKLKRWLPAGMEFTVADASATPVMAKSEWRRDEHRTESQLRKGHLYA